MTGKNRSARDGRGMDRREFLALVGAGAAGVLLPRGLLAAQGEVATSTAPATRPARAAGKPNIVVIVADDLGYADVAFQGSKDIPIPHIDSIARSGVRFSSGYVTCPVCSPTRAGLMTGRYQQRFGHEFNPSSNPGPDFGLPLAEATLPGALKGAGYATGMVGKWHLGEAPKHQPPKRGFDEFFGFLGGSHSYLNLGAGAARPILRGAEPVAEKEYLTDAFTREAVAFIERHGQEPFFLYLTYNAVHAPLEATRKYLDRFGDIKDKTRRTHAAMLAAMDDGVGAVLAKLRQGGLGEDTLVFFLSDNGGPTPSTTADNRPLRGFKAQVYEGGIRVPFLAQWAGHLPPGKVYDQPINSLDIFPTCLAAAGAEAPKDRPLDGVNLIPYLTGRKEGPPHDALFWRFGQQMAVRQGNWKLVRIGNRPAELYDLEGDIGESKDLAAARPEVAKRLADALEKWNGQLVQPLWGGQAGARRRASQTPASRPGGARP